MFKSGVENKTYFMSRNNIKKKKTFLVLCSTSFNRNGEKKWKIFSEKC